MSERLIKRWESKGYSYLLYLPESYKEKALPLLLFLHGAGEKGNNLNQVKAHGPPKLIEEGQDLPFIVLAPQCPKYSYWHPEPLKMLLEEVIEETQADKSRIYITGISMGGYGTWALTMAYPEIFAAAVPICGGGDARYVNHIKNLPVWNFHGAKDFIVPVSESDIMVKALENVGGNVKYTIYPEADHDSWTQTYENKEVFEWLLSHKKK